MPNWKKVLVSGSNAELGQVTASIGFKGDGSDLTNVPTQITVQQASDSDHSSQHYLTFAPNNNGGSQNLQTYSSLKYNPSTDTIWSKALAAVRPRIKYTNNSNAVNILGSGETTLGTNSYDSSSVFETGDSDSPITMKPGLGSIQAYFFEGASTKAKVQASVDTNYYNILAASTDILNQGSTATGSFTVVDDDRRFQIQPSTGTVKGQIFQAEDVVKLKTTTNNGTGLTSLSAGNIGNSNYTITFPGNNGTLALTTDT